MCSRVTKPSLAYSKIHEHREVSFEGTENTKLEKKRMLCTQIVVSHDRRQQINSTAEIPEKISTEKYTILIIKNSLV